MSSGEHEPSARLCPICGRPATPAYRPFCTRRCADVDLNRWLSGAYAIPAEEAEPPGDDRSQDPRGS